MTGTLGGRRILNRIGHGLGFSRGVDRRDYQADEAEANEVAFEPIISGGEDCCPRIHYGGVFI